MKKLKARVIVVEDANQGLEALGAEAQRKLNAFLSTNSLREGDIRAFSVGQVTDASQRSGLLISVVHVDVDPFSRG